MFMPQQQFGQNECEDNRGIHNENVYCLVPQQEPCRPSRYKSPFSAKVRWDSWVEKKGCCKTIGPPPNVCIHCPEHFLRKHSRQVPVFFSPGELRVDDNKDYLKRFEYQEPPPPKKRLPPLDTGTMGRYRKQHLGIGPDCPFPRPPSRLGLFRHPIEPSYEKRYRINRATHCNCDEAIWEELVQATERAGVLAAQIEKEQSGHNRTYYGGDLMKDYIRSNAVHAIRMPARRLKRCYIDQCGVHLLDMSDSPYVLRPGFGKVPQYIYRRKMELYQKDVEAKRRMEAMELNEAAEAEGVQLVDEMEKEYVVNGLKEYWADLLNQYNSLPLQSDTEGGTEKQRELKHSLEERMKEVEQDLRLLTSAGALFVGDVKESRYL